MDGYMMVDEREGGMDGWLEGRRRKDDGWMNREGWMDNG